MLSFSRTNWTRAAFLGALVGLFALQSAVARADLIANWEFNEGSGTTFADSAGHLPGELYSPTDNLPTWVAGHSGAAGDYALSFNDGETQNWAFVMDVDSWLDKPNISNAFTITAWIYSREQSTYGRYVSGVSNYEEVFSYAAAPDAGSGKEGANVWFRGGADLVVDNLSPYNQWCQIAVTYAFDPETNVGIAKFYTNGTLMSTQTLAASSENKPKLLDFIRFGSNGDTRNWEGVMDSVYLYDSVTIPEPNTLALLIMGVTGLLAYAWRKRK